MLKSVSIPATKKQLDGAVRRNPRHPKQIERLIVTLRAKGFEFNVNEILAA